jgi:GxxExxY protein
MPIEVATKIHVLGQEEFHALDRRLMGIVFDVHNQFGRFLDEELYQREIAARWVEAGAGIAEREVRISLTHETFRKDYRMDLFFNGGLMLETKTAEVMVPAFRTQGLNYLFLTGLSHARLINLRPEHVEHEFLSTRLTPEKRRHFKIVEMDWHALNAESTWFREKLIELLKDWGAFLEAALYRESITHFLGGAERVVTKVPVHSGSRLVGAQPVHLLTRDTAFAITALTANRAAMQDHQMRFLKHTPLQCIQWVNLNHHEIEFTTLTK